MIKNAPLSKHDFFSFAVGSKTTNLDLCDQLFACDIPAAAALEESLHEAQLDSQSDGAVAATRTTCTATGVLCPSVSIGCALCAVFLPQGTCGTQCIIGGLYCGTSAYSCMAQAAQDEEEENPRYSKSKFQHRMADNDEQRRYREYMEAVFNRR